MLLNNFFYIDGLSDTGHRIVADIHINVEHEILKGHFPQQPVVPGVCVLEMMKEVLQSSLSKKLMMTDSAMIKFLTVFAPPAFTNATYEIDYKTSEENRINVTAALKHESTVFLKFKGVFEEK